MNYILGADCVIFRTVPDGEIFRYALNSNCAFEVDETDELFESGWSVVAVGRLQLATEGDFASMRYGKLPEPWAGGSRWLSYGCRVSRCPDGGSSATVGERVTSDGRRSRSLRASGPDTRLQDFRHCGCSG